MALKIQSVKLREKDLIDGGKSLYLDIMWDGKRIKETLGMHVVKPKTTIDRNSNKQTYALAEQVRANRQIELKNNTFGISSSFKLNTNFIAYFKKCCEFYTGSTRRCWDSTLIHVDKYFNAKTTFHEINKQTIEGFRDYLKNDARKADGIHLSINSQSSYNLKFRACLNRAISDGIIPIGSLLKIKVVKLEETHREHLTIEEVRTLAKTKCRKQVVKDAFLFSCLTGLRISDILKMKWSEVQKQGNGWKLDYRQQKTQSQEYLDISNQAHSFLGKQRKPDDLVFDKMKGRRWYTHWLKDWISTAKITRDVTFHCARHTFATLQLSNGTDLYTVSKLLGHKDIKTTQIYAKIIDSKKKEAMNRIPDINL